MTVKSIVRRENNSLKNLQTLFWSYFHNKMMMFLMMIEHPYISRDTLSVDKQRLFLHDIYHHFLPPKSKPKYHRAFQWLNLFLDRFPDNGPKRTLTAIEMVKLIYEAFGFRLEERLESVRLKSEMLQNQSERKA